MVIPCDIPHEETGVVVVVVVVVVVSQT